MTNARWLFSFQASTSRRVTSERPASAVICASHICARFSGHKLVERPGRTPFVISLTLSVYWGHHRRLDWSASHVSTMVTSPILISHVVDSGFCSTGTSSWKVAPTRSLYAHHFHG